MNILYVGDVAKKVIYLTIDPPGFSDKFRKAVEADGFRIKKEFHVTIAYSTVFERLGEAGFRRLADRLNQLPKPEYTFQNEVYFIALSKIVDQIEYPRESLVTPVMSSDIKEHIASATDGLLDLDPFLHVTLCTRQDNPAARIGIGIPSNADWQTLQPKLYTQKWQA